MKIKTQNCLCYENFSARSEPIGPDGRCLKMVLVPPRAEGLFFREGNTRGARQVLEAFPTTRISAAARSEPIGPDVKVVIVRAASSRVGPFLQGRQHARSESSAGSFSYDEDISGSEERADRSAFLWVA